MIDITSDERQAIRNRLFNHWFKSDERKKEFTMLHETVTVDGISYFGNLLMRKDHPMHDTIVEEFHDFAMSLPDKLNKSVISLYTAEATLRVITPSVRQGFEFVGVDVMSIYRKDIKLRRC